MSAEQEARDLLTRAGVNNAQTMLSGDLVELANLIALARKPTNLNGILLALVRAGIRGLDPNNATICEVFIHHCRRAADEVADADVKRYILDKVGWHESGRPPQNPMPCLVPSAPAIEDGVERPADGSYRVAVRRELAVTRPEVELVDGKDYQFIVGWAIETGLYKGEWAMVPLREGYPIEAPSWLASGDLQPVSGPNNG